ncbi:MAG: EVE domain-containing protein [Microcystaceae cyanobacterium]
MAYWLFQGNPKYYRLLDAIQAMDTMPWLVTRYAGEMQTGDGVLVWMAGADAGIYGIAEIQEPPKILSELPDRDYWLSPGNARLEKPRVQLHFLRKLLGQPLRRQDLKQDPILKDLLVLKAPNSTNFRVTPEQWQRVHSLKG